LEHFGSNAFALKELPRMLKEADAERLVRDVVDELSSIGRSQLVEQEFERILIKMACHGMLRANQRLSQEEMQALLVAMDETPFISHCPHGRPTFLRWTHGDVERLFKRA
jgi:DNA mismatch repair protein MutL